MTHAQLTHPNPWDQSALIGVLRSTGLSELAPSQPSQVSQIYSPQSRLLQDSNTHTLRLTGQSEQSGQSTFSQPPAPFYPPPPVRQSRQPPSLPSFQNLLDERETNIQASLDGIRANLNDARTNLNAMTTPIQSSNGTSSSHRETRNRHERLRRIFSSIW